MSEWSRKINEINCGTILVCFGNVAEQSRFSSLSFSLMQNGSNIHDYFRLGRFECGGEGIRLALFAGAFSRSLIIKDCENEWLSFVLRSRFFFLTSLVVVVHD